MEEVRTTRNVVDYGVVDVVYDGTIEIVQNSSSQLYSSPT